MSTFHSEVILTRRTRLVDLEIWFRKERNLIEKRVRDKQELASRIQALTEDYEMRHLLVLETYNPDGTLSEGSKIYNGSSPD